MLWQNNEDDDYASENDNVSENLKKLWWKYNEDDDDARLFTMVVISTVTKEIYFISSLNANG